MSETALYFERWFDVELTKPLQLKYVPDTLFWQDNSANLIGAKIYRNGSPYEAGVTSVIGYCLHEDGTMHTVAGTHTGNRIYILLPNEAYSKANEVMKITVTAEITLSSGGPTRRVVVAAVVANVIKARGTPIGSTVSPVDPSDPLVTYAIIAAAYNPTRETGYSVGEYCTYNNLLYRCTVPIPAGGETWNGDHWVQVTVGQSLTRERTLTETGLATERLRTENVFAAPYDSTSLYFVGDYCTYANVLKRCVTQIGTPEEWTGAHWQTVTVGERLTWVEQKFTVDEDEISTVVARTVNLYNKASNLTGVRVQWDDGKLYSGENYVTTALINVTPGTTLRAGYWTDAGWGTSTAVGAYAFYQIDGTHVAGGTTGLWSAAGITVPADCTRLRFCINTTVADPAKVMLSSVSTFPASYKGYWQPRYRAQDTNHDGNITFTS